MLAGIPNFVLFTFVGILVAGHLLGFIYYVYTLANEPSLAEARDPSSTRCVRLRVVPMQGLLRKLLCGSCAGQARAFHRHRTQAWEAGHRQAGLAPRP